MDALTPEQKERRIHILGLLASIEDDEALTEDERSVMLHDIRTTKSVLIALIPTDPEDETAPDAWVMLSRAMPDISIAHYETLEDAMRHCALLGFDSVVVQEEPLTTQ